METREQSRRETSTNVQNTETMSDRVLIVCLLTRFERKLDNDKKQKVKTTFGNWLWSVFLLSDSYRFG